MLRQIWHVLVVSLLLSFSINTRGESTTISSPTDVKNITEKYIETASINSTTILEMTTNVPESNTTTTTNSSSSESTVASVSESTTTIPETTTIASTPKSTTAANTSSAESTATVPKPTTTANILEPTTTIPEMTTTASTPESTTAANTPSAESTATVPKPTTTANVSESTTTVSETTTIANVSESTTNILETTTAGFTDNQTIENSTMHVLDTLTTESSKFDSTVNTTANLVKVSMDMKSYDVKNYFPHAGKPKWGHIEPSKPMFAQNDATSSINELVQEIIPLLAEYINNQTSDDLSDLSSSLTDLIVNELTKKLDQSELNLNPEDFQAIRGTVKVVLKNLPGIIHAIISNIEKVDDKNCPIKFQFFQNIYCLKFELNFASSPIPTAPLSIETTTNSPANISIQSFKVFTTNHIDTPPTTWQQWLNPLPSQDQIFSTTHEPAVVCYYTNWAQYRNGPGRFYPENIDPNLCTHIVYAFAQLINGVIAPYEWNDESTEWSTGMYARIMNLRKANRPKILLAVGGWNHGSGKFSDMVHNETKRATFVTTTIIFLQKHNFDGLDLDWEYPGSREGSRPTDKDDFIKLIIELKTAFRSYSLLLTAAVGAGKPTIDAGYDIPKVCDNLDLVNLMAYDLHGSWETQTGLHVALYSRQNDTEIDKQLTVDWAVRYWIDKGCSASKLVMGLALYGRTFRLASSINNQIGAAAVGPGSAGLYTGEGGFLAYYEICTRVQQQNWTTVFDDEQKSNYAYKGVEWVGYDDIYSIGFKIRYAKDMGLAGIMFWAPDLDDFTGGLCNEGKYPLMNTAVNLIRDQTEWTTSTKSSTTSTTTTTTQPIFQQRKRVVCYYTNWAQYRPDGGKFLPENLDASLCTHIIYAFAVLKDSKLAPFEWNDQDTEWSKGMYSRIIELKKSNSIQVLLAVGGWNFGSGAFSDMVGNEQLRKGFVQQATQFIRDHQFDGLDLDWEFPGSREGSRSQDKQLFTTLVKELKVAFQPYNLLLTAAVSAGASTIENGYEIDQIAPNLDFINLMTYDLHGGGWENFTGLHTALYARPDEDDKQMTLNQNWAVNYWIQQGMPKEKVSMGLATYGRTYKLVNNSNTGIGAPSSGAGEPGKYTRESGFLAYYEICEKLNSGLWTSKYDDVQKSMYAYGEGMWVGYDNIDTLTIRANYIIGKDLGGVMIWAPDLDDFSGNFCNRGRYPLMNTVVNLIRTGIIVPIEIPTIPTTTTTTTTAPTTTSTLPTMTPSIVSPSVSVNSPSVVCMTTVNPFVFNTLNVKLCSHLIIVQTGTVAADTDIFQSALSSDTLEQLKVMKTTNDKLKIFYSILGQWKSKHLDFIRDDQQRKKFNQQIKQYLIDNYLDGFDIDWNIQADQISALTDKYLLSTWLLELQNAFASDHLSLSIGISGDKTVLDSSYELNKISNTVDFIRLMAFDWPSKNVTTLINPLFPVNNDQRNNINWAVDYVLTLGVPPKQISLGIPTYGRWFGLADSTQNIIGSPTIGSSMTPAYSDICKLLKTNAYIKKYNQPSRSSYSYNEKKKQWISSDTVNDVALKARFAKLEGLGGVTLSSIGMDDVDGQCGQGPYPLLNAVSNIFGLNTDDKSLPKNIPHQKRYSKQNLFCSVSSQAETYHATRIFTLDKIDPHLCTHLLIENNSSLLSASISDRLKDTNPNLKILLTINVDDNDNIDQWKEDVQNKKADGLNININSNTFSNNITELLQTIQSALSKDQFLTVSFQLPTDPSHQVSFFNLLQLYKFVDYVIILPFDGKSIENFNEIQPWNSLASFVQANPDKNIGDYSTISTLVFILSSGVPKNKLILSIPTYGLSFLLEDENKYQIGNEILAEGFPGRMTHTIGMLASYEICDRIQSDNYERFLSNESIIVIAHKKKNFITFDDTQPLELNSRIIINGTVQLKANYIKNSQLAGVLVHSIDMDDYTGLSCHQGTFPITSIVSRIFSTPMSPSTTTTQASILKKIDPCSGIKTKDLVADESDCRYYYVCMPNHHEPVAHLQCPNDMHFSSKQKACTQEQFLCSSQPKLKTMKKSAQPNEVPSSSTSEIPFVCPTPNGVFPDSSDCARFFACSNNLVISMKCPLKTKFNSQLNRCDWLSNSCP